MSTTALPLSAGLIMISSLSCISLRADLSVCVQLSVLWICTSTVCLISDLIRSMTDSSLVYLLGFGIQLLFLTNLGISVTSFMSDSSVDRSSLVNCKTPNVVYLLDCHVCGSQYVGESVQPFSKRMNGHRSDLTKKTLLPVSQHFVSPGHSLDDFGRSKIYIIDHNPNWKENQRQKRESFWIRELQTLRPEGINKKA